MFSGIWQISGISVHSAPLIAVGTGESKDHVNREVIGVSLQHLSPYIGNFLYFGGIGWDYSVKAKFILPLLGLFLVFQPMLGETNLFAK